MTNEALGMIETKGLVGWKQLMPWSNLPTSRSQAMKRSVPVLSQPWFAAMSVRSRQLLMQVQRQLTKLARLFQFM